MSDNKQKSTLLKDAIILFVITIIAAFALGAVYEITKDPIAEAEAKAKASETMFTGSERVMLNLVLQICNTVGKDKLNIRACGNLHNITLQRLVAADHVQSCARPYVKSL